MTKVGVFVEKDWQYDMYFLFFMELFPKATIRKSNVETIIIADSHRVHIYKNKPTTRGMKFDIVITLVDDKEYNQVLTIPALNCSKFIKEGYN